MSDSPYLTPTADEAASLRLHIQGWEELDDWPRSVSVAILRGRRTVAELAKELGATKRQVRRAVSQLIGRGLLYDGTKDRVLLK